MSDTQKDDFLNAVSVALDEERKSQIILGNNAESKKRLKRFSQAAHNMKVAIDGLRSDADGQNQDPFQYFAAYFDELLYITKPKIKLQSDWIKSRPHLEGVLEKLQVDLTQLEAVAEYANDNIWTSKGDRPDDDKAKRIAASITVLYKQMFDNLPPYNRNSWFAGFMQEIGAILKITIGENSLKSARPWTAGCGSVCPASLSCNLRSWRRTQTPEAV